MDKIFIVIVTYNGLEWIDRCLMSCNNYEVIVVDNSSKDGTVDFINKHYPSVCILPQNKNLGFGGANNIGISKALELRADYVFLLNQDAYLEKHTIELLVKAHQKNNEFGILSPIHLNGEGTRLDKNFSSYMSYSKNKDFYSDFILDNVSDIPYQVPFVNAAAWLLPKSTLKLIGGFDPIFFHYGEDDNYCQKVNYEGLSIGVLPTSFVRHDREGVIKRENSSYKKKLLNFELKKKIIYANVNLDYTKPPTSSLMKNIIKYLYYLILKGTSFASHYLDTLRIDKKAYSESKLSVKKFKNRENFIYL